MSPRTRSPRLSESQLIAQATTLDRVASGELNDIAIRRIPLSLRPDARVSEGCAANQPYAKAIQAAWKPDYRITVLDAGAFDALSERSHVDFHGRSSDVSDAASVMLAAQLEADCG